MSAVLVPWEPLEEIPKPSTGRKRGIYVPVDYPANGQVIYACRECVFWEAHVDIIPSPAEPDTNEVVVREWHREDCEILAIIRGNTCHADLRPGSCCTRCGAYNANLGDE